MLTPKDPVTYELIMAVEIPDSAYNCTLTFSSISCYFLFTRSVMEHFFPNGGRAQIILFKMQATADSFY
jgi:hypothetical protein